MENTNFDRLLQRYLFNELSEQEKTKFEAWLDVLKKEQDTDLEMSPDDEERLFQKITSDIDKVDDVIALYPRKSPLKKLFSKQWMQIAASVVILLSIALPLWYSFTDFASAQTEKTILNDGTIVWLQPGSKFTYVEKHDGTRIASLTGEALFEVAKIPNSTFTILCGQINVKVLGTSFALKTGDERIELKVLTGKVSLTSIQDSTGVNVAPNEKVNYSLNGHVQRDILTEKEVTAITADTEYNMTFRSAAMKQVIESVSKKFNVSVSVSDENLYNCHVSADFTDTSLENTLKILHDLLGVTYSIDGRQISLSGKGC